MVSVAVFEVDPNLPVIVAVALTPAVVVVTLNDAVVLPAATLTEFGTLAPARLLASDTVVPPDGASAVRVTVPVDEVPPKTVVGLRVTDSRLGPASAKLARHRMMKTRTPLKDRVVEEVEMNFR